MIEVNDATFSKQLDSWLVKAEKVTTNAFKEVVNDVFDRILMNTPQYSGAAVANWNVSIGTPNLSYDTNLGDKIPSGEGGRFAKGDTTWMSVPDSFATQVFGKITYADSVYISNGVRGDDAIWSDSKPPTNYSFPYLAEEYNKGSSYYQALRSVNLPIETLEETAIAVNNKYKRVTGAKFDY